MVPGMHEGMDQRDTVPGVGHCGEHVRRLAAVARSLVAGSIPPLRTLRILAVDCNDRYFGLCALFCTVSGSGVGWLMLQWVTG